MNAAVMAFQCEGFGTMPLNVHVYLAEKPTAGSNVQSPQSGA
jgi:hypothetical protein